MRSFPSDTRRFVALAFVAAVALAGIALPAFTEDAAPAPTVPPASGWPPAGMSEPPTGMAYGSWVVDQADRQMAASREMAKRVATARYLCEEFLPQAIAHIPDVSTFPGEAIREVVVNNLKNERATRCDAYRQQDELYRSTTSDFERMAREAAEQEEAARRAQEAFVAEKEREWAAEEAYRNSPEGLMESACQAKMAIASMKQDIARERETGRRSGFVDAELLHDKTKGIQDLEEQLAELKQKYRQATGKPMDLSKCPG